MYYHFRELLPRSNNPQIYICKIFVAEQVHHAVHAMRARKQIWYSIQEPFVAVTREALYQRKVEQTCCNTAEVLFIEDGITAEFIGLHRQLSPVLGRLGMVLADAGVDRIQKLCLQQCQTTDTFRCALLPTRLAS